ncbi:15825_t:CDS:2 [Acaulospora colombiana]|uniref:15825_t:CDS:1 n=1 Tax=Acaulospora colombiana TaxID=27376 RepID=A0ACA9PH78_9GLOM|nr:15825_t:CDS:2 [Acaulospora colombiana]
MSENKEAVSMEPSLYITLEGHGSYLIEFVSRNHEHISFKAHIRGLDRMIVKPRLMSILTSLNGRHSTCERAPVAKYGYKRLRGLFLEEVVERSGFSVV